MGDPMSFTGGGGADPLAFVGGGGGYEAPAMPAAAPAAGHEDMFAGLPNASGGATEIPKMTPLREWESKHAQDLEEIETKEVASKTATRKEAEDELKKWYEERKENIEKKKASNKKAEVDEKAAWEAAEKPGANAWERVADLIDTNARTADEARDTSRMRALLIHLKANPVVCA